jgi:hypothetical protein
VSCVAQQPGILFFADTNRGKVNENTEICAMEPLMLDIFPHPDFVDRAKLCYEKYDLLKAIGPSDPSYSKRNLKNYKERICRFCSRRYPQTTFSNYSHLLPQLIGNGNMYSDFECDECNLVFSSYESDLAEFLGISRSITGMKGEKKTKGFAARKLSAKSRSFIGNNILIIAPEDVKREGNKTTIKYTKNAFTPTNVYKALLKSALSLLSEYEIKRNYKHALDYLSGKVLINQGALIGGYNLTFSLTLPLHVYVFQKKIKEDTIPTHLMAFHFQNHIIVLPIPLHVEDMSFHNVNYDFVIPPPYFINKEDMDIAQPMPFIRDLSFNEKVTDEEESITYLMDAESLKNAWAYDPITDRYEQNEYGMEEIKYIILIKDGLAVDAKELSAFIKEQMEGDD